MHSDTDVHSIHIGYIHQMAEQEERRFIGKVSRIYLRGRVIPAAVQQLEHPRNIITPTHRKIGTPQIGKVHKVQFLLIGKLSPTKNANNITHQAQRNLMLQINLYTLVRTTALQHSTESPLPIYLRWKDTWNEDLLYGRIHIIVLSRSPGEADAGSKTIIGMAELFRDIRVKIRKEG